MKLGLSGSYLDQLKRPDGRRNPALTIRTEVTRKLVADRTLGRGGGRRAKKRQAKARSDQIGKPTQTKACHPDGTIQPGADSMA